MANGIKALRQIQLSRETTQGTPTTDFEVWRGEGTLADVRETVFPAEDIGIFGGTTRNYTPSTLAELTLDETPATFEQLYHLFDAGLYNSTSTTDTGSGYVRTYTLPITQTQLKSSSDLQTMSVKAGDNNEVEKSAFLFIKDMELSGVAGEALMVTATFDGREVSPDTDGFSTFADIPAVEEILFSKCSLYIDDDTDSHGTTLVSNTLLEMNLSISGLWMSKLTANGRTDYSLVKMVQPEISLDVTFEHDSVASAEKAVWRTNGTRLVQMKFEGSALTSSGTYTYHTLILNLTGAYEAFDTLDEQDGNDTISAQMNVRYDATSATYFQAILVNEVA